MSWTRSRLACFLALSLLPAGSAPAQSMVNLQLIGSDGSRWFDFFSDAYAELGLTFTEEPVPNEPGPSDEGTGTTTNDGFGLISGSFFDPYVPSNPDTSQAVTVPLIVSDGSTGANVFVWDTAEEDGVPGSNAFRGDYVITLDAPLTGVGTETRNVVGFAADFAVDIADSDAIVNQPYTTTVGSVSGTATFVNGEPTNLDFEAELAFSYDFSFFVPNPPPGVSTIRSELGSIVFDGLDFDLLVADPGFEPNDPLEMFDDPADNDGRGDDDPFRDPQVTLSLLIPGDYDGNGFRTNLDHDVFAAQFGGAPPTPFTPNADGNFDDIVTAADYVVFRDSPVAAATDFAWDVFGVVGGVKPLPLAAASGAAAIPEPQTVALVLAGVALVSRVRGREGRRLAC